MTDQPEAFDIEAAKNKYLCLCTFREAFDLCGSLITAIEHERAERARVLIISDGFEAELRKLRAEHAAAIEAACWGQREHDIKTIQHDCGACGGSGHYDEDTQCEYCGRPMDAVRQSPLSAASAHTPNGVFVTEQHDGEKG